MPTQQELEEKYAQLTTAQLLIIVESGTDYTELAFEVAINELNRRQVSADEIQKYEEQKQHNLMVTIQKYTVDELTFWQKVLFYFIFVPLLASPFKLNYRQDGYALKLKQANYYNLCGFIGLMLAIFLSVLSNLNSFQAVVVWVTLFMPGYFFDERFNQQYLLKKLNRR